MRKRKTTTARGYGRAHQALRRALESKVKAGLATCWRCGELIKPGEKWHLGHSDHDRSEYKGPEHVRCNCATSGRSRVSPSSRDW